MIWLTLFVFDYDPATGEGGREFETSIPQRPWDPVMDTVGGHKTAASGESEGYVVRRDSVLVLKVTIWEFEWPLLWEMVSHLQDTMSEFTVHSVRSRPGIKCRLVSPVPGEKLKPTRGEAHGTYNAEIEVCRLDGEVWDERYFGDLGT